MHTPQTYSNAAGVVSLIALSCLIGVKRVSLSIPNKPPGAFPGEYKTTTKQITFV